MDFVANRQLILRTETCMLRHRQGNLNFILQFMARNYKNVKSNRLGTFHLGDERTWEPEDLHEPKGDMSFWKEFDRRELEYVVLCPLANFPPQDVHTLRNVINCGRIFEGRRTIGRDARDVLVPAFVRPGHEDAFLDRRAGYFRYDSEGLPRGNGPPPTTRQGWIRRWG